jgi:hypothetical protein
MRKPERCSQTPSRIHPNNRTSLSLSHFVEARCPPLSWKLHVRSGTQKERLIVLVRNQNLLDVNDQQLKHSLLRFFQQSFLREYLCSTTRPSWCNFHPIKRPTSAPSSKSHTFYWLCEGKKKKCKSSTWSKTGEKTVTNKTFWPIAKLSEPHLFWGGYHCKEENLSFQHICGWVGAMTLWEENPSFVQLVMKIHRTKKLFMVAAPGEKALAYQFHKSSYHSFIGSSVFC